MDLYNIGAAYIRVSTDRQEEYSPTSQLKLVREYAAKEGYDIPDEYVYYDDGISGRSTKKRDAFNSMIAAAKDKKAAFTRVYVWKFSRFARNSEASMVYKNLLARIGIDVVSVSEPIPEGPFGDLIERIIEWSDEYYSTNLSAESRRGLAERFSRGEPNCPPPYGYKMIDSKYIPDEESGAADVIREIFTRYADGESMRALAVSLGKRGVKTRYGNTPDNRYIEYILSNPCYIGKLRLSPAGERHISRRHYSEESIEVVQGKHQPLISEDLWNKVQASLKETKEKYVKYSRDNQVVNFMLKGLVRCSSCGATLVAGQKYGKKKIISLQCHNYARGSCHVSHSISTAKIDVFVIESLRQALANKIFPVIPKVVEKPKINFDALIGIEQRKLERAKQAFLAEIDTLEQYKENKEKIEKRIAELERERGSVPVVKIDPEAISKKVADIIALLEDSSVSIAAKNEALRSVIEKIIYNKSDGTLAIYFHAI